MRREKGDVSSVKKTMRRRWRGVRIGFSSDQIGSASRREKGEEKGKGGPLADIHVTSKTWLC